LSVWFEIKNNTIKIVLFLTVFLAFYFLEITFLKSPHRSDVAYENNNFKVFGLNIPSNLRFCDEPVPVDNFEIRTNLEGEFFTNKYWKNNSAILFNKVAKWFPYIEPILKQEGVPDDVKYIAVIESHLSNQVSPAGAVGFWQLMPSAARNYGLIVNDEVDERLDVEKATHAACKFFKEAHKRFNNWTLSAAAYNLGMGGVERAIKRQKVNNYYDLLLNQETGEFVYRLMAYKTLLSNPIHYGIKRKKISYYSKIPVTTIKIDSSITDLTFLAKYLKCNKTQIKLLNPWLVKGTLTNPERQVYTLKIPQNLKKDYSMYYVDLISEDGYMYDREEPETVELPKADSLTARIN
jgi:membrane-bound lytic murein transglycosylase D